jgi:hypothetical protein
MKMKDEILPFTPSFLPFVAVIKATLVTVLNVSSVKLNDLKAWVLLPDLEWNLVKVIGTVPGKISQL